MREISSWWSSLLRVQSTPLLERNKKKSSVPSTFWICKFPFFQNHTTMHCLRLWLIILSLSTLFNWILPVSLSLSFLFQCPSAVHIATPKMCLSEHVLDAINEGIVLGNAKQKTGTVDRITNTTAARQASSILISKSNHRLVEVWACLLYVAISSCRNRLLIS